MKKQLYAFAAVLLLLCSCTEEEKKSSFQEDGGNNAYITDKYEGKTYIRRLYDTDVKLYKTGFSSYNGYDTALKNAVEEVCKFSNLNFKIDGDTAAFKVHVVDDIHKVKNAFGSYYQVSSNCLAFTDPSVVLYGLNEDYSYIIGGDIYLGNKQLSGKNESYKEQVILHEFGHVMGLDDITDDKYKKYSIMYVPGGNDTFKGTYYPEWDEKNIEYMYGGTYN